jgi:acylphosphatase
MSNQSSKTTAVSLHIFGKVQGVGYRQWMRQTASKLGINGWVKNCNDGSVLSAASGPAHQVEALIALCKVGPSSARVKKIEVLELTESDCRFPEKFEIQS